MMRSFLLVLYGLLIISGIGYSKEPIPNVDSLLSLSFAQLSDNLYSSKQQFEDAIPAAKTTEDATILAKLYAQLGIIHHLLNKSDLSVEYFQQAILLYEESGDEVGAGNANAEMGYSMRQRDFKKAMQYMSKGIALLEKNNSNSLQSAYDNFGVLSHQKGEVDSALLYYEKAYNLKKQQGNRAGLPYSLQKIATAKTSKNDFEAALLLLHEALKISEEVKDTLLTSETLTYYGELYWAQKNYLYVKKTRQSIYLTSKPEVSKFPLVPLKRL